MIEHLLRNTFVAGGEPKITYNPRSSLNLEEGIREYLDDRGKLLSISGPTKSGKTVLVRKMIPKGNGLWIPGGQISSEDEFWEFINNYFGSNQTFSHEESESSGDTSIKGGDIAVKPGGIGGAISGSFSEASSNSTKKIKTWNLSAKATAIESISTQDIPIIIDDFHYIDQAVQSKIVKALKDPVFEGAAIIAISVPHRAFDTINAEKEMTGRVKQITIPLWNHDELEFIALSGFDALNVFVDMKIIKMLAVESFGSPHLMQDFCNSLCKINGIKHTQSEKTELREPDDWNEFFKERANETSKPAFNRLAMGPRQRADRKNRPLKEGGTADIYVAILKAIAQTGPKLELTYEEIRNSLRNVLHEVPQAQEVSRVLEKMTKIATKEKGQGDPVLDWHGGKLYISDPFLAYYMKWAVA